jgi:hypothetical protein
MFYWHLATLKPHLLLDWHHTPYSRLPALTVIDITLKISYIHLTLVLWFYIQEPQRGFWQTVPKQLCIFLNIQTEGLQLDFFFCPATRHEGAWGEKRYSSYSFSTSTLDGSEWSASVPGRALPPVPIGQEAGWAPEPVWTQRLQEKSSASVGDRTLVVQSVVRHYTDWATPAPYSWNLTKIILINLCRSTPNVFPMAMPTA